MSTAEPELAPRHHPPGVLTEEQLTMPAEALLEAAKLPLEVHRNTDALYDWLARSMADEIVEAQTRGELVRWIVPVGPQDHYSRLVDICNQERISWHNVWSFHMDEFCDWQGREVPLDHPYSMRGWMARNLYARLNPELRNPPEQVIFPRTEAIEEYSEQLREVGGADRVFAGVGFRGHLAFNESPNTRWTEVSAEQLRHGKTRMVTLTDDTMIAHSQRSAGGVTYVIPPMAITVGMGDILDARRVELLIYNQSWKQFILRTVLLGERDVRFPATLCQDHPGCRVSCDAASAEPIAWGFD
jgi:glucosamine-6-phosphate deaminase